jgi:hypothetical protein
MIRKIAQIERRLAEIEDATQQLNTSDLFQLRLKADEAEAQGRDLLKDMASQIEIQIDEAQSRLSALTNG